MKDHMMRAVWFPYRFLIAAALLAAVFCLLPIGAGEPEQGAQPLAQGEVPRNEPLEDGGMPAGADLTERTQAGAYLHTTLRYAPCGHSVQRREELPAALRGLTRAALDAQVETVLPGAKVTGFSAQEVDIVREAAIPCPLHWVLAIGENGRVQVMQNITGEALAVVRETETTSSQLGDEQRSALLEGMIFDDVQQLEGVLESLDS